MTAADLSETDIEAMTFAQLDDLRHQLRMTKKELCEAGDFDPSTYTRWMRHARGEGGSAPQPRSIKIVKQILASRLTSASVPSRSHAA